MMHTSRPTSRQPAARAAQLQAPLHDAANWAEEDEDVAIGCECADPQLQIDDWREESTHWTLSA